MYKVIDEYHIGGRDLFILTLNERRPHLNFKKCRIDGREYDLQYVHYRCDSVEKSWDAMLRSFSIKATAADTFVGKEVEFV